MERFDISESGRLADMVSAAERGEEVEITRDGRVVAHVVGHEKSERDRLIGRFKELHASLSAETRAIDWGAALREARETD